MAREYKDSGIEWIGQIPKEWKMTRGKFLFSVLNGYAFDSSLFTNDTNMMPLIRIRDINSSETEAYYMGEYPSDYIVHKDDVLVGMDGDFNVAKWKGNDALLNQRVCKIKTKSKKISNLYGLYLLKPQLEFVQSYKVGTTVSHLGKGDIDRFKVILPPIEVVERFSALANSLLNYMTKLAKETKTLSHLRDTLLPKLMSGEIEV